MATAKEVKDLVQEAIDKGATTVEEVHQAIARMPIEVLEKISPDLPFARTVADVQKRTIGSLYDAIRLVNKTAGEIAEEILGAGKKPAQAAATRPS